MGAWWLLGQIAGLLVLAYLVGAMLGCGLRKLHDYALGDGDEAKRQVGAGAQPVIEVSGSQAAGGAEASRFEQALSHGRGNDGEAAGASADVKAVELDTPSFSPIDTTPSAGRANGAPTMDQIARELRTTAEAEKRAGASSDEPSDKTSVEKPVPDSVSGERPKFAAAIAANAYRPELAAKKLEAEAEGKRGPSHATAKSSPAPEKAAPIKPKTQWPAPVGKGFVEQKDTPKTFDEDVADESSGAIAKPMPSAKVAQPVTPPGENTKAEGPAASVSKADSREGGAERGKFTAVSVAAAAAAAAAASRSGSASAESATKTVRTDETKLAAVAASPPESDKALSGAVVGAPPADGAARSAHDLTRIKGIDSKIQARLVEGGVTRYEQIAGWQTNDVAEVEAYLAAPDVISRGNWIEQADILARGGSTIFSRMKDRGELPKAAPQTASDIPAPKSVAAGSSTAHGESTPVAAKVFTPAPKVVDQPVRKPTDTETSSALKASPGSVRSGSVATPIADNDTGGGAVTGLVAGSAAVAAAVARVVEPSEADARDAKVPDALTRISGVDDRIAGLLNGAGVTRFEQIANWSDRDVGHYEGLMGAPGRVERERWIFQSQYLARGEPVPSGSVEAFISAPKTAPRSPLRAVEAPAAGSTDSQAGTSNYSGFRSVRSRALRSGDSALRPGGFDDLKRVRGVGVLIEKKLNSLGVTSYADMANWTKDDIDRVSQSLGFKGRIEQENWVEQARILAAGGQTEFSRRMDRAEKL